MKVVVTGGAGFIGANVVRDLHGRPEVTDIVVVDDYSTGSPDNLLGTSARTFAGTILDPDLLAEAFDGADSIIHLAALPSVPRSLADPLASHHAIATGTLNVLQAARVAGSHVILSSSSSVYGANRELPKRESMRLDPISPYAVAKQAAEAYTLAFGRSYGLPVLAFRFFNVYGPLQAAGHAYAAVVPTFIDAALNDRPLIVNGDGFQTRDFTFVGSVTRVLADAAIGRVVDDSPVNLAFGTRTSLNDMITMLGQELGFTPRVEYVAERPGDVRDSQADNARLQGHFPDVRPVPLPEGLAATVAWFRSLAQRPVGA
ncbi:NAD-dependent epimerase/dehydratase family protein [Nostocoides vanveenii]|uniref:SDR family oxidoreductase n=1 Tax=Nostocoides vanveenii TaxID=330835 RepID=A0ABN2KXA4_9MICO